MKVRFITFGCRLNRAEALEDEAQFVAEGWELTQENSKADLFVVRGCSVTARAQRDCEKYILHLRKHYPQTTIIIRGCLPGAISDNVRPHIPSSVKKLSTASGSKPLPQRTARAYLKVQDGCSGKCTFCIVPKFRGKSTSEDFNDLIDKARRFIDNGYRELVVTGCNLSLYASNGKRIAELIAALSEIDRGARIRLGSLEPGAAAKECVHAIAENGNICRFLHIPVQSGSDKILKAMQRPYTVENVYEIVNLARSLMPNIALGCDMMAGFPGENQTDFNASVRLLQSCRFANAHVFPYSERPGTPAATFPSPIPKELRSTRAKRLAQIAKTENHRFARGFVSKRVEVLIEDEKKCAGWTSEYLWFEHVRAGSKNLPKRRKLATFTVSRAKDGILTGK